jgi:propionyl-CoA carboxylase alpha chain
MKKILVANRGEIALRVMRTAKKMGIRTVAIYSEADRDTPHVYFADEAVCVGPAPSSESYLNQKKIIQVCKDLNVDGIHPGYGFLSENAKFARAVTKAGIKFIGPSPHSIKIMGSKLDAKQAVKKYDIPMVPGINEAITDIVAAKKIANEIGYPILIKASAGGGGKGMRIVENDKEFEEQMNRAVSEAVSAFGDGSVFIEKYVGSPRHIEIQVLADSHGNCVHLFERECSIQRRHQKVIEEAPSAVLDENLRNAMGEAAINVAKSCNYEGAGTVEFLLDENKNFYFLEMNTRLQVEHPVTEMITGVDLVEQQILVARGNKLAFSQEDLLIHGHAIELRVYAEDPTNNFLPSIGKLTAYSIPVGEGIRVDDAYKEGMTVPIHYDPMIAKLAVHAETRKEAIELMKEAIQNYKIEGIATTLDFGLFAMNHKAFVSGNFDTHFVGNYYKPNRKKRQNKSEVKMIAEVAAKLFVQASKKTNVPDPHNDEWYSNRS